MMFGKIKVKRLRLSEPMAGISIRQASPDSNVRDMLCRVYAKNGVNLTFISAQQTNQKSIVFCCVIAEELDTAKRLLDTTILHSDPQYQLIPSVTLVSVFPHQSDTRMVFQLLQILLNNKIPVHAVASSIAALTLVVDTNRIKASAEALEKVLNIQPQEYVNCR